MKTMKNRHEAGQLLAKKLKETNWTNAVVLALPRGGVPVAAHVARSLDLPWDILLVKKITAQKHSEFAVGAVSEDEDPIWSQANITSLKLTSAQLRAAVEKTRSRILEQTKKWRQGLAPLDVQGKTVIVVDDGLATGLTMISAVEFLIRRKARKIVVAVPVASVSAKDLVAQKADRSVVLYAPERFLSVGEWYEEFTQVTDEEVTELLQKERARQQSESAHNAITTEI